MSDTKLSRKTALVLFGGMLGGAMATRADAANFPTQSIRLIVPFAPGGGADAMARIIGPKTGSVIGQDLVIENHGGANGNIGAELVARAKPDGYTILIATANLTMSESLYKGLPFNVDDDFQGVTLLAATPNILAVNNNLPAKSVKELIALAKASPGKYNFASDQGGPLRLGVELLDSETQMKLTNVPYNGTGAAILGTLRGDVSVIMAPAPALLPYVKSGKLRGLAVSSATPLKDYPDLPTIASSGVKGFDVTQWYGILAPKNTPKDVVDTLNAAFTKALQEPDVLAQLQKAILVPVGSSPDSFSSFVKADVSKWAKVVKAAGIPMS